MNVYVTQEQRFVRGDDGLAYTENDHTSGYPFFQRYLEVFETVTVVGRLGPRTESGPLYPVTGPRVFFAPVPFYLGPLQYLQKANQVKKAIRMLLPCPTNPSAYIARAPGTIGSILSTLLRKMEYPYAMEVLGDPYESFRPGAVKHPLRSLFRFKFTHELKKQCLTASAVAYVTKETLQKRYSTRKNVYTTHYSSIELDPSAIATEPHIIKYRKDFHRLVFVGSLAQLYKGVDVLIEAIHLCRKAGINLEVEIIGDGKCREDLIRHTSSMELQEKIHFLGALPSGKPVRERLNGADLFVLPSKGEGLPRALIEAMAQGLPCIATNVGGIPELLPAEDLVPPGNATELANRLIQVLKDPTRMQNMATRNLQKVKDYEGHALQGRRNKFYAEIKTLTDNHNQLAKKKYG